MLSTMAVNLYWMGRYIERADFLSLLLDATARLSALPATHGGDPTAWSGALAVAGAVSSFSEIHDEPTEAAILQYLGLDPANPSSIINCIDKARSNARAAHTGMTQEAWEVINTAWHDVQAFSTEELSKTTLSGFTEVVERGVAKFDGRAHRTMLRDDAYWFLQLGAALERADNTARLLDVKYHLLLPGDEPVGGRLDHFQWSTILRTVSALGAYYRVYRDAIKPWLVADLLIFDERMPRSLTSCYDTIVEALDHLDAGKGGGGPAQDQAGRVRDQLRTGDIETVFASGLHEFLGAFIDDNGRLASAIAGQFGFLA